MCIIIEQNIYNLPFLKYAYTHIIVIIIIIIIIIVIIMFLSEILKLLLF